MVFSRESAGGGGFVRASYCPWEERVFFFAQLVWVKKGSGHVRARALWPRVGWGNLDGWYRRSISQSVPYHHETNIMEEAFNVEISQQHQQQQEQLFHARATLPADDIDKRLMKCYEYS